METTEDNVSFISQKENLQELFPSNYEEKVGETAYYHFLMMYVK